MSTAKTVATTPLHIAIEPFKRDKYDRGSKKILVGGEEWGTITMTAHGCHGPSYHAHDLHGPVIIGQRKKKTGINGLDGLEHKFWPKTAKKTRWENIGKPDDQRVKPIPTDEQLRVEVEYLIAASYLRSPAVRQKELDDAGERFRRNVESARKRDEQKFSERAKDIVAQMQRGACGEHLVNEIIAAMKWAQVQ